MDPVQKSICETRFAREKIFEDMSALEVKPPKVVLDGCSDRLSLVIDEMSNAGITEDMYQDFKGKKEPEYQRIKQSQEIMETCLTWMRYSQGAENSESFNPPPCLEKFGECSFDCPKYKEATEEQASRFIHGHDVDTGDMIGSDMESLLNGSNK